MKILFAFLLMVPGTVIVLLALPSSWFVDGYFATAQCHVLPIPGYVPTCTVDYTPDIIAAIIGGTLLAFGLAKSGFPWKNVQNQNSQFQA